MTEHEIVHELTHQPTGEFQGETFYESMSPEQELPMLRLMVVRMAMKMQEHGILDTVHDVIPHHFEC